MLLRIALFALMAVGLLGFGTVAWVSTHPSAPPAPVPVVAVVAEPAPAPVPPPPPAVRITVLVAAHPLRAGSFLRPDDVRAAEVDEKQVPPGTSPDSPAVRSSLNGAMLRRAFGEGEALTAGDLFRPGDPGFLASVLKPGSRAVMIGLNGVESGAGFVWPGDRVDVILIEKFDGNDVLQHRRIAGETVLEDVRVVAVDQQMMPGGPPGEAVKESRNAEHRIAVEVGPDAAERLAVAPLLGKLTVSLRAVAEPAPNAGNLLASLSGMVPPEPAPPRVTWGGDVSRALGMPVRPPVPRRVEVFRGTSAGGTQ